MSLLPPVLPDLWDPDVPRAARTQRPSRAEASLLTYGPVFWYGTVFCSRGWDYSNALQCADLQFPDIC